MSLGVKEGVNVSSDHSGSHQHSLGFSSAQRSLSALGHPSYLINLMPLDKEDNKRVERVKSTILTRRELSQCCYAELLDKAPLKGKIAEIASVNIHSPCRSEITRFLIVMSLTMVAATSGQYMNVCTFLFEAKYDWETTQERDRNQALMNVLPALGMIVGSAWGSVLIQKGRARAYVVALLIGIVGSFFTLVQNWPFFLFCKIVVGVSTGLIGVIVARYIEEWVPLKWFGISQAISLTSLQLGVMLATLMGLILPPEDEKQALVDD